MRIAIDIQGLQSESRFRGIGRYVKSIVKALALLSKKRKFTIILVGNGAFNVADIISDFSHLVGRDNIVFWSPAGDCFFENPANHHNNTNAKVIREAFFKKINADVIYIPAMFEGYQDNSVLSVGEFDKKTPVVATLYDLIPLHNPAQYLDVNQNYKKFYLEKVEYLKRCKKLLAISEFSQQEGQEYFTEKASDIVNVSTAGDDIFEIRDYTPNQKKEFLDKFSLDKPFLLYSGGADERKNIPALISALSQLPENLRQNYDFVIAGKLSEWDVNNLTSKIKKAKLDKMRVHFTGYISDDDLVSLYNLCYLFVFPSWHEGFGLPALEAMACGAVVVGAGNTSLPEVIGNQDALFDPHNINDMRDKIERALTDNDFYADLKTKGKSRSLAFSWERSAEVALTAIEEVYTSLSEKKSGIEENSIKKRLAYFTPLSPARSGIALYSEELLPELVNFYDVDVVVDTSQSDIKHDNHYNIINVDEFIAGADNYDRIIYQMGNSVFHEYMHEILEIYPGIVCLHDFYLSNYYRFKESQSGDKKLWSDQLLMSHGYKSLIERSAISDDAQIMYRYPSNFNVLSNALAVIVHSDHARKLAEEWYHGTVSVNWEKIPLLRHPAAVEDRSFVRKKFGIDDDVILICSFGIMDITKLNHQLIEAIGQLSPEVRAAIKLVFVGELGGSYEVEIHNAVEKLNLKEIVNITGWASDETYRHYLMAADIAVQLRSLSRGETSAAVLDCMNYGLPTIINANGSMAELPEDKVVMLHENFTTSDLTAALESLCLDSEYRKETGSLAASFIHEYHSPQHCAKLYYNYTEEVYVKEQLLINDVIDCLDLKEEDYKNYSNILAYNFPRIKPGKKIFFDVSLLRNTDLWTGIERVTRALLGELLKLKDNNINIIPVYLDKRGDGYVMLEANNFISRLYENIDEYLPHERCVDMSPGDVYFSSELACDLVIDANRSYFYNSLMVKGVHISFMIHDILPITRNEFFPPGSNESFSQWLDIILTISDKIICVTDAVRMEVQKYFASRELKNDRLQIDFSHHGADISAAHPNNGVSSEEEALISSLKQNITFLMVGTIEPRKGHLQAISAFEKLWRNGCEFNLVIVGKEGWKSLPDEMRRTIPDIVKNINNCPKLNKKLFWFNNASDELLSQIYAMADCLLYPSEDEGFGLPLIEASQHKKSLISRDVPVLREVAQDGAYYFDTNDAEVLADIIIDWSELYANDAHPKSSTIYWMTWAESARNLVSKIIS